jgi:gamma-glutamyltranspeptidase
MTPQSGLLFAAPESAGGKLLSPVIVADDDTGAFYFAGAAAGGDAAQQNLVRALLEVFDKEGGLRQTLSEARIAHDGYPDIVWAERILTAEQRRGLEARGHEVEVVPSIGEVHGIYCPEALRAPQLCEVAVDPRSFALPLRAD